MRLCYQTNTLIANGQETDLRSISLGLPGASFLNAYGEFSRDYVVTPSVMLRE
jgi:hypothetical protein